MTGAADIEANEPGHECRGCGNMKQALDSQKNYYFHSNVIRSETTKINMIKGHNTMLLYPIRNDENALYVYLCIELWKKRHLKNYMSQMNVQDRHIISYSPLGKMQCNTIVLWCWDDDTSSPR